MPALGRRASGTIGAGPRAVYAFLAVVLIGNVARAKVQELTDAYVTKHGAKLGAVPNCATVTQNFTVDVNMNHEANHTYPMDLRRKYDGIWDSSDEHAPFQGAPSKLKNVPSIPFQRLTGFVSLDIENKKFSKIDDDRHYVFGSVLLRDGKYRTMHDNFIVIRVFGIYEFLTGKLILAGDFLYDENLLERLYKVAVEHGAAQDMDKDEFEAFLGPLLAKHRDEFGKSGSLRRNPLSSACDYQAVLSLSPGSFTDELSDFGLHRNESENVEMSGVLSSSTCKTNLNVTLATADAEAIFVKAINYTLLVTFVSFTQVLVLIRQMEMTSTQAGANRVSLLTIGLQTVNDSYLCLAHLTMGIAVQSLFNAFATAAFFKFIIFSIFEMRYMLMIWKARRVSGFSRGWDSMRRELSILYSRFYGSLLLGIMILYKLQQFVRPFMFLLYSFWLPQIVLNVVQDHRRSLHPLYVVGISVTRLAIPMYFLCCPRNFLHFEPQYLIGVILMGWVALQAGVLLLQHRFGARCFIPKRFLPEKYDYYRPLAIVDSPTLDRSELDLEQQDPGSSDVDKVLPTLAGYPGHRIVEVDCVICMQPVVVNGPNRMATPCEHVFHEECLQQWMDVKMECPTCRGVLPPF